MPIYRFNCAVCGYEFEELTFNYNGKASIPCHECSAPQEMVHKIVSGNVNFKINGYSEANGYSDQGKK